MKLIQVAKENERFYTKEFIHGFNTGAKTQYEADKKEVRHGRWENDGHTLACSNCHTINIRGVAWDYCPHCGAIMDKEENE